ncbi:MAG: serine hydrolase domain-containing protein [Myxococcota bacterium]|jgi:CubicO group peptidase (beta-lactamase class C family)
MRGYWVVAAVTVFAVILAGCADSNQAVKDRIASLENGLMPIIASGGGPEQAMALNARMAHYLSPAVSVAVINNGGLEWAKAWGNIESGQTRAADMKTRFQACSLSKPVAAASLMTMVQEGALRLDDDANMLLKSWKIPQNAFTAQKAVTARMLMSHTSGINVGGFGGYAAGAALPTLVQILNGQPPANNEAVLVVGVPGGAYSYSGGGYEVIHQLLQDLSGEALADFAQERLFRRLWMTSSSYVQPPAEADLAVLASGHDGDGTVITGKFHIYPELGAAGLWTTPGDLARFLMEMQQAAGGHGAVLTAATAGEMLTRQVSIGEGGDFGLGFMLNDGAWGQRFSHSGANAGFRTFMVAYRDRGQGVVIMTNSENGLGLIQEILYGISRIYGWPDYKPQVADVVPIPQEDLQTAPGRYAEEGGSRLFDLIASDGALMISVVEPLSSRADLYPVRGGSYLMKMPFPGELALERDAPGGVVTGMAITTSSGVIKAAKVAGQK